MPRLLRLKRRYAAPSPSRYGGQVRDSSPLPVSSTLMTSAPRSPSNAPHQGPAITRERSTTRMPSRASGKGVMAATIYLQVSTGLYQLGRAGLLGEPEQREGERDDHGSHHHPDRAERSEPSDQSEKDRQRRDLGTAGDEQRANDVVHHRDHDAAP